MTAETQPAKDATGRGRKIIIETHRATREIHICRLRMALLGTAAAIGIGWTLTATAGFIVSTLAPAGPASELALVEASYQERIATLGEALETERARADAAESRLDLTLERIVGQQMALQQSAEMERELTSGIAVLREKLAEAMSERDLAEARAGDLDLALSAVRDDLASNSSEEMSVVLAAVSDALRKAVRDRDSQRADLSRLESQVAAMELKMEINADRQQRMVASLEDAVQTSFGPLEKMFEKSGLDVDILLSDVRRDYTGYGGPDGTVPSVMTASTDPDLNLRLASLMTGMDRMNMMQIAAAKVPFTMPVRASHRFTSGFGMRSDPKTGGRRAHEGIDLAAPRGTKIEATGEGTVVFAGRQGGYGNLIRIRHAFGFETRYAHLNKIHVKTGDRIARGDHIGDMGTTGRSTGVHLHYEVLLDGKPVNPLTYIKAARDVF